MGLGYNSLLDLKMTQLNWVIKQFAEENKPGEESRKNSEPKMNGKSLMPRSFKNKIKNKNN